MNNAIKTNKTETKAIWTMKKHGFTWAGDSIFANVSSGKRALTRLANLGLAEIKSQEPGFLPEFKLSADGEELIRYQDR
jgi:hypothetical protein